MRIGQVVSSLEAWGLETKEKCTSHQKIRGSSQRLLETGQLGAFVTGTAPSDIFLSKQGQETEMMIRQLSKEAIIKINLHYFHRKRQKGMFPIHAELSALYQRERNLAQSEA